MRFFALSAAALASASFVAAENITVVVGANGGLTYQPSEVKAKSGDTIQFQFVAKNHTVTQSTFAKPCEKMTTPTEGIDSGFLPVPTGATEFPVWSFTVQDDTAPLWFYCAQQPHCSKGMVFAVNPTAEKSFAAFQNTAMGNAAGTGASGSGSASGSAPTGAAGSPSGSPAGGAANPATSGSPAGGAANPTTSGTAAGAGNGNNGAASLTMSTAGLVSIVGMVAGLLL